MEKIYDEIRKCWVPGFPEEYVRQKLIKHMTENLGYPASLISVEHGLKNLSQENFNSKNRRADIVCFAKDTAKENGLFPLLIIECKACKLTKKATEQVIGYNYEIKAYFIAVANDDEIKFMWYNNQLNKYESIDYLPPYDQLLQAINT